MKYLSTDTTSDIWTLVHSILMGTQKSGCQRSTNRKCDKNTWYKTETVNYRERPIVKEIFGSETKTFFDRLSASQAIDHTLNIEKCKLSENYEKEESCLSSLQVRSKPLLIDMEWPPGHHFPTLQRHRNIKDVLRPASFESQRVCALRIRVLGKLYWFTFSLLIFMSHSLWRKYAGVQYVLSVQYVLCVQ